MKALVTKYYDYYEDTHEAVLGIFETQEQRDNILEAYKNQIISDGNPPHIVEKALKQVQEIDFPVGVFRK